GFTLVAPISDVMPQVASFVLAQPPQSGSPATDPTVIGTIVTQANVSGVTIQLDYDDNDNNGTANQTTTTDALGRFSFLPVLPSAGSQHLRVRTEQLDSSSGNPEFGEWVELDFAYGRTIHDFRVDGLINGGEPPPITNYPLFHGHVDGP